ncbi:lipoxygenase homology domain-containing 1-like, partial [Paramuricea clavata]
RAGDRRPPRWTPPRGSPTVENGDNKRKTLSKSSNNSAQSDTSENVRNQVHRRKAPKKNAIISPYKPRPATAGKTARRKPLEPSLQHAPYRPQSARFEYGKTVKKNGLVIGMNSSDDEMNMMNNDQKFFYKRSPKPNVPRIRTLTYQIYVLTGDCRGAGTEADIKLTLFGEYGTSGERPLLKSMNHPHKFRRGQVDIFPLDSLYLGELQNIRIGHSKTTPEHGWFLEKVYISEGKDSNRVFEFPCQRWFSSQKDDGQIVRDVSVSGLLA